MNRELIDDMRWKAQESLPLVRKQYQSEVGFPSGNMLTRGGGAEGRIRKQEEQKG
jgi:hypothetical protein